MQDGPLLYSSNPTQFARDQYVIYGSTEAHEPIRKLARSYLNLARIRVPPFFAGQVHSLIEGEKDKKRPFHLAAAVKKAFASGFAPWALINGEKVFLLFDRFLCSHRRLRVGLWRGRNKHGIVEAITYFFHDSNIAKLELALYCESKDRSTRPMRISFGIDGASNLRIKLRYAEPGKLLDTMRMLDGQGRRFHGSLLFHDAKVLADPRQVHALMGEEEYPLYALHAWKHWGPWQKKPPRYPSRFLRDALARKIRRDYRKSFGHFGEILNKMPGDTGAQPAFGTWQHLDTVGGPNPMPMLFDQLIVAQESCRPIHYFEEDGSIVQASKHKKLVIWDDRPHWHKGVSPDRLGRTHKHEGISSSKDWFGRDRQHYSATWLSEDVILNGSYGSMREMQHMTELLLAGQTVASLHPKATTNSMGAARGIGRTFLGIVQIWLAMHDDRLIERSERRLRESILPHWPGKNVKGPIKPMRLMKDRRYMAGKSAWIVWEDAICIMGLDAMAMVFEETGRREAAELTDELVWKIGRGLLLHGWHPEKPIIAKAIRWLGDGKPPPRKAYDDPGEVILSYQTDYSFWAMPALAIMQRRARGKRDLAVAERAKALLSQLEGKSLHSWTRNRYLGAR